MKIIGVTGGIGSGKSTVARMIASLWSPYNETPVIDADQIAKSVVVKGSKAFNDITSYFGTGILTDKGELDRRKLGELVFGNTELVDKLNEITHKHVIDIIDRKLFEYKKADEALVVLDVPIPVKRGFLDRVDEVWTVIADRDVRIARIMARSRLTREAALSRINAQMSDEQYMEIADRIIINNGSLADLKAIIEKQL